MLNILKNISIKILFIFMLLFTFESVMTPLQANADWDWGWGWGDDDEEDDEPDVTHEPGVITEYDSSGARIKIENNRVVLDTGYETEDEVYSYIIEKYKTVIVFFSAIAAITMAGIFIFLLIKLGATSTNPQERSKILTGLLITGIATALLGSVSLFVGLFYNMLKE